MKQDTKIVSAGRKKEWTQGSVNPPVQRASTIVFDTVKEMKHATANRANKTLFYGRRGTSTSFALSEAMCEIEGGVGCALYPCGTAAITSALLSFLEAGDHLLMVDTAYEPTRDFCNKMLTKLGIETTYYDPMIGAGINELIKPNTKVLFLESPGSNTMEVQDVPTLSTIAHQHDITVMLDNTWGSGINFKPFDYGVDISIQAATKYIVGHSDVMIGTATANEAHWPTLRESSYLLGQCVSADDCYLALRGLRTLGVRMKQHEQNALKVAHWLKEHPSVERVLHPAFEECPGHEFFKRDFNGSNGLFSFVLNEGDNQSITEFLDSMTHFKMGFSWGGYESLILKVNGLDYLRTAKPWPKQGAVIRVHIGLEDVDDLIADLDQGLKRLR
ncbi:cystathionine beta-lyase [Psychrobium sp. 1_MG-2023]|uniref:cystathionine beta-lyase n=1 Tax=Psychrobium sp. 1_MG-2023 TaxID=3062624 RepID=UPI000C34CF6B|nr:cystathionine beta-lyase [Psychrobium sp. 1_MG-2023]MDP2561433.1 cystathionine beta-lyase [Psychrobium sp. 1_MG-2023]PKF57700.1 cystathionine beta-lyase [Alteromonadales bacterium alter-6D02]